MAGQAPNGNSSADCAPCKHTQTPDTSPRGKFSPLLCFGMSQYLQQQDNELSLTACCLIILFCLSQMKSIQVCGASLYGGQDWAAAPPPGFTEARSAARAWVPCGSCGAPSCSASHAQHQCRKALLSPTSQLLFSFLSSASPPCITPNAHLRCAVGEAEQEPCVPPPRCCSSGLRLVTLLSLSPALPLLRMAAVPFPPSRSCLLCHLSHLNSLLWQIIGPQVITHIQIITNRSSNRNELS